MKRIIIALLFLFLGQNVYADDILYSWDFRQDGNAEGWRPTHDLTSFTVLGGVLKTTSTGADPYMHGPTVDIDATKYAYLKVKMKVSAGSTAEFFWTLQGMAGEQAGYEQPFDLMADNHFHEYLVYVGSHSKWKGKVIRLRLDPTTVAGAKIEIDYIQVLSLGARLEVKNVGPDVLLPKRDQPFHIGCMVASTGDKDVSNIRARLLLSEGLTLLSSDTMQVKDVLAPEEEYTFQWPVSASQAGSYSATITVNADSLTYTLERHVSITVESPLADLPQDIPTTVQVYPFQPHFWIMENANLRLVIDDMKNFRLYAVKDGAWFLLGASQPVSRLEFTRNDEPVRVDIVPDSIRVVDASPDSVQLRLTGQFTDEGAGVWSYQFSFSLGQQAHHINSSYQIQCSQNRDVLLFTGPSIYLGEGSFGEQFEEAILPGLEWLVEGEHSSNTLDAHPPINLRFAPHPRKITAPIMALNSQGITAGMFWDMRQKWDGVHAHPAIEFSVPNWLEGQKNHKMAIMLPSIPEYIAENHSQQTTPYPLSPGQVLTVSGRFFALPSTSALDAFDYYFKLYGDPALQPLARSLDEEVALCRWGFQTVWSESRKGWQHAMGQNWGYEPYPGFAYLQYLDALMTDNPNIRNILESRVKAVEKKILQSHGETGLASRAGCHIAGWQFPFYVGHLDGALTGMKSEPTSILYSQSANGGWPYKGKPELGQVGKYELGTCAHNAFMLLYYYQISGSKTYLSAAESALEFMRQFKVPRGAQTWEVPLHTPDILAAAHAVRAYVTAYRLTHKDAYLQQARYWARSGLPFIYFWADPEIVTMPFATIPVLGATFYTHSWFGIPVQWNGLVYAHALFELAEVDVEHPLWRILAEGITRSGMLQQRAEGNLTGTYPDSWNLFTNSPQPVYINPEDIIKNVLFLMGRSPELNTVVVNGVMGNLHLTSAAELKEVNLDTVSHEMAFQCDFLAGDTCYVLIAGASKAPANVAMNDKFLNHVDDVDEVAEGWQYTPGRFLIVKFLQPQEGAASIRISNIKTGVDGATDPRGTVPSSFQLRQNYPNPFRVGGPGVGGQTTIEFYLPKTGDIKVQIYDINGRLIRTLLRGRREAGAHRLTWNGQDAQHVPVASGLYLCRLEARDRQALRKILVIK